MSTSLGASAALVFAVVFFIGFSSAQTSSQAPSLSLTASPSPPIRRCGEFEIYESCWRRRFIKDDECNSYRFRPCSPRCLCRSGFSRFRGRCIPSRKCPRIRDPREDTNATMSTTNSTMDNSTMASNTTGSTDNSTSSMNTTDFSNAVQLIVNLTRSPLCEKNGTDGFYPVKDNCTQYVLCVIGTGTILECPQDLVFANESRQCVAKEKAMEPCGSMKNDSSSSNSTMKNSENGGAKNDSSSSNSTMLQSDKDFEPLCEAKGSNGLFLDPQSCSRAIACIDSKAYPQECVAEDKPFFNSTLFRCTELPEGMDKSCVAKTRVPRDVGPCNCCSFQCLNRDFQAGTIDCYCYVGGEIIRLKN